MSHPARFCLLLIDPLEGYNRAGLSPNLRIKDRFSAQWSFLLLAWSSWKNTSSIQFSRLTMRQCSRTMALKWSRRKALLSRW